MTEELRKAFIKWVEEKREDGYLWVSQEMELEELTGDLEMAFEAGVKEGGVKWHDLRKNPDDLPDSNRTVFAVARVGGNRQYPYLAQYWKGSKVEWCCWRNNMQRELVEPDAWCEIPTFEE